LFKAAAAGEGHVSEALQGFADVLAGKLALPHVLVETSLR